MIFPCARWLRSNRSGRLPAAIPGLRWAGRWIAGVGRPLRGRRLGHDGGGWAAKRRKGRKNGDAEVGVCHRDHGARTQRRRETSRMSNRADSFLGSTSVFLLCQRSDQSFSQESNRVNTETIPASDRPRWPSCATDRISLFRRRRSVPNRSGVHEPSRKTRNTRKDFYRRKQRERRTGGWPQKSAKGAKVGVGGCHKVTELGHRGGRRKNLMQRPNFRALRKRASKLAA
jgi:hypothetical protein